MEMENKKDVNYFGNLKLFLKIIGISLNGYGNLPYKLYSCIIFSSILLYGALSFREIFLHNFDTLINTLFIQFSVFLAIAKDITMFLKRKQLERLMRTLENKPFLPNPERGGDLEERLVKECVWITNMQHKVYCIGAGVSIISSVVITLIKHIRSNDYHDWELPYGSITVLDVTDSSNFEITYIYQLVNMCYLAISFSTTDLTVAALLAHISYQFKVLKNNMKSVIRLSYQQMLKESKKFEPSNTYHETIDACLIPWTYLKSNLTDVVEYHSAIIQVSKELEDAFSELFLIVFLGTLGLIAFMIYHMSMMSLSDKRIYPATLELLCGVIQVLLICYWGEQVLSESQSVGDAVFDINFYGADIRFQKALILIIRRCQNPVAITAKKFTVISLYTFAWILQKSYAAFMVLQNNKNK